AWQRNAWDVGEVNVVRQIIQRFDLALQHGREFGVRRFREKGFRLRGAEPSVLKDHLMKELQGIGARALEVGEEFLYVSLTGNRIRDEPVPVVELIDGSRQG